MPQGPDIAAADQSDLALGRLERVFDVAPMPMAIMAGQRYRRVNRAFCTLVGLGSDELIGQHFTSVIDETFGARVDETLPDVPIGDQQLRGHRLHVEGPVTRPDGEERWVSFDAVIVDDRGETTVVQITDLTELQRTRAELQASERRMRSLLTNMSETVSLVDVEGNVLYATGTGRAQLGYPGNRWKTVPFEIVHPDDMPALLEAWQQTLEHPDLPIELELRMRDVTGAWRHICATGVNLVDDTDVGGIVLTTRDVTDLRRAERLASSQASVLELIAGGSPLAQVFDSCVELVEENGIGGSSSIYLLDGERLVMQAGKAPQTLNDYMVDPPRLPPRSLCDSAMADLAPTIVTDIAVDHVDPRLRDVCTGLGIRAGWSQPILDVTTGRALGTISTTYTSPHEPSDHERRVAEVASSLVAIALDRTEQEAQLAHIALHDPLTDLPNRSLLLDRLGHSLARSERTHDTIAVLFCDIDRFKVVNDSLGHGVGDQLLAAFADRLRQAVDTGDTVARFGGDEFVVLLEDVTDPGQPVTAAAAIARALEEPFVLDTGREVYLTASIGLTTASDRTSAEAWLRDADAAMYRAKERGRNRLEVFDSDMREAAMARLQIESDLRRAIEREELVIHYQPVVDLASGRISGAEALVRWEHPLRGLLGPDKFIGVAEDTGMIHAIGLHVLETAVRSAKELSGGTNGVLQIGVNVSVHQLSSDDIADAVADVCERYDWPPEQLLLEITESAFTPEIEGPVDVLHRIHRFGARLAIDDFGTGYSSLSRLGHMQVDQVKIDRTFVNAIDRPGDPLVRIVDAVAAVAGAVNLTTCGEGVETEAQLHHLRGIGCEQAQGYLFAKPLPLPDLAALIASDPRW